MIPKIIHYCWFGRNEKSQLARKCIKSWKKYCPDYKIIEWNEDNFDVNRNDYTKMCYEQKKYAFLSDYVRLVVVAEYGGIYYDTDVELIKTPDFLLKNNAFLGFENMEYINTGLGFGSIAQGEVVESMLKEYDLLLDGMHGVIGCPELNTNALMKMGLKKDGTLQIINNAVIYPVTYFNPYECSTGRLRKTQDTISIHWYAASWLSKKQKIKSMFTRPLHRLLGIDVFKRFRKKEIIK